MKAQVKRFSIIGLLVALFACVLLAFVPYTAVTASAAENVAVMGIEFDKTTATYDLRSGKIVFPITATIIP
ncbi:MAG: hypothetical protein IKA99_07255 [Clostridia bacterium]|nr:hypothetical protein [Clostridia bacterium]